MENTTNKVTKLILDDIESNLYDCYYIVEFFINNILFPALQAQEAPVENLTDEGFQFLLREFKDIYSSDQNDYPEVKNLGILASELNYNHYDERSSLESALVLQARWEIESNPTPIVVKVKRHSQLCQEMIENIELIVLKINIGESKNINLFKFKSSEDFSDINPEALDLCLNRLDTTITHFLSLKSNLLKWKSLYSEYIKPDQSSYDNTTSTRLKFNCSPSVLGFIISELLKHGYIDAPTYKGQVSMAGLAKICHQIFDVHGAKGTTTLEYWKNVIDPTRNQLTDSSRAKLSFLPDLSDLK